MTARTLAAGLATATVLATTLIGAVPAGAADTDDGGQQCGTTRVTAADPEGWSKLDGTAPEYVRGPAGSFGAGSLKLTANVPSDKVDYYHGTETPLAEVTDLGYWQNTGGAVQPAYELKILGAIRSDGTKSGFTTLVWEPYRNGQTLGDTHGWVHEDNIQGGHWWSTRSIAGATGGQSQTVSLADIAAANPDAVVKAYGVNLGRNNAVTTAYVDSVRFGCSRANFEPGPAGRE